MTECLLGRASEPRARVDAYVESEPPVDEGKGREEGKGTREPRHVSPGTFGSSPNTVTTHTHTHTHRPHPSPGVQTVDGGKPVGFQPGYGNRRRLRPRVHEGRKGGTPSFMFSQSKGRSGEGFLPFLSIVYT